MAPGCFRLRRRQQVCFQDRAGVERQAADGHFRQTVLEADHLALLGDAQAAFEASRRLRQQRCVCRRAATANRATASVEQGQLNTGFLAGFDQCVLRLILRPGCRHHARIFRGVGIANHHHLFALNKAAVPVDIQQLGHDVVGGFGPAFIVADAEIAGQLAQRFGMTGTFLTYVDTHQRHAKTLHAAQGVEQFAVSDDAHPAGLQ